MSRLTRGTVAVSIMAAALSGCVEASPPGSALMKPRAEPVQTQARDSTPVQAAKTATANAERFPSLAGTVTVKKGDTLYSIARAQGVPIRDLITWNGLDAPYDLHPGRILRIPPKQEHVVAKGDTVYSISRQYGVDMTALVRANGIAPPYAIRTGQRLKIPTESIPATKVAAAQKDSVTREVADPAAGDVITVPLPAIETAADGTATAAPEATEPQQTAALPAAPVIADTGSGFLWPVRGRVLSAFGAKQGGQHNDGINIAVERGAPVQAADKGRVIYAGNELRGFGNLVLVKHADGWTTAYAHNDKLLVKKGDTVARGETIARAGSTGSVATPQVHFELRRGTRAVDPVDHLGGNTKITAN